MALLLPFGTQFADSNNDPVSGGSLTVYENGTTTLVSVYTDEELTVATTNPVVLDSAGRPPLLYVADNTNFSLLVRNAAGATVIPTKDDVWGIAKESAEVEVRAESYLTTAQRAAVLAGTAVASEITTAIQSAITALPAAGGVINFGPGYWPYTAPAATQVAANEGSAFQLTAADSNITFRGASRNATIFRPAGNRVEIFAINGATNTTFEKITFDNSANGVLQNQIKQNTYTVNSGVSGLGNHANAAIQQYTGAGLTVKDCKFIQFNTGVHYIGDNTDSAVLSGDLRVEDCEFTGCAFEVLAEQPVTVYVEGCHSINTVNSVNADASVDPGHLVYVTNRTGAFPENIVVSDIYATNNADEVVKVRKGEVVNISNINIFESARGVMLGTVRRGTVSNVVIKLATVSGGTASNNHGIELTDCGNVRVSNCVIDVNGQDAWGVRLRSDLDSATWHNIYPVIEDVTVIDDQATTGKAPLIAINQEDLTIRNFRFVHTGSVDDTRHPIDLQDCVRARVYYPEHISDGTPADDDHLVSLDADCENCRILFTPFSQNGLIGGGSFSDSGTGTVIHAVGNAAENNQDLTGAGAISNVTKISHIISTGTDALTLANGLYEGQEKFIVMQTDGGAATLTPTALGNGTTIVFDDVGDSAHLVWTNTAWHFVGGTATLS